MFSCNMAASGIGFDEFFNTCRQGPTKIKKIGQYIYHYDYVMGNGTYSQVYEGLSLQTNKPVAIKVIDLGMIKQKKLSNLLFQETQLLSQLNHPNVIKCYALLKSQNRCYIVTELCKKDNLQTMISKARNKKLPSHEVERIIYDIFQGLQYLSQKSIIHRDLKTANILFSQSGKAKIADFGFATQTLNEFKDSVFVGTPLYMSPQAIIQQKYGPKTDIWSFGVIIYELFFGFAPLSNCKSQKQLLQNVIKPINISSNSNIPQTLVDLLEGCLEPNSVYRWGIDKLAKSPFIQNLKKKQTLHQNIFQPLKITGSISEKQKQLSHLNINTQSLQTKKQQIYSSASSKVLFKQQFRSKPNLQSNHGNIKSYVSLPLQKNQPPQQQNYNINQKKSIKLQYKRHTQTSFGQLKPDYPILQKQSISGNNSNNQIKMNSRINYIQKPQNDNIHQIMVSPIRYSRQVSTTNQQSSNTTSKLTYKTAAMQNKSNLNYKKTYFPRETMSIQGLTSFETINHKQKQRKSQMSIFSNNRQYNAKFSLFTDKKISYKQAVSLVHYCRLLHKIIQFPRYYNNYLHKWLIYLIKDLKQNANVTSLKQTHLTSLRTVLQGYYNQYTAGNNIEKDFKQFMPQIKSVIKILKSLLQIDLQNNDKSQQKQLLTYLIQDTRNLQYCLTNSQIDIQSYTRQSKCEIYLDCFNNKQSNNSQTQSPITKIKTKTK